MNTTKPSTVDEYINTFTDAGAVAALKTVRAAVLEATPDAVESIGYGIPTLKQRGKVVVHFGGFKTHVGFYATPTGRSEFADELKQYKQGKGSVQFPLSAPMPVDLIKRIVRFRLEEVEGKK